MVTFAKTFAPAKAFEIDPAVSVQDSKVTVPAPKILIPSAVAPTEDPMIEQEVAVIVPEATL
jgi:hypothetical protein